MLRPKAAVCRRCERSATAKTYPGPLPDLIDGKYATETQPLTSTLAVAGGRDDASPGPAIVHRKYGSGQVVSLGVEGLWRWGLNSKAEGANTPFRPVFW